MYASQVMLRLRRSDVCAFAASDVAPAAHDLTLSRHGTVGAIHESPALLLVILSEGAQRKKQACFYSSPAAPVVILSEGADRKKEERTRPASDRVEGPLSDAGLNELLSRG